ncbi:MAG TPA: ABC transporter substrate-binding protein [Baekduia sp.]|nr:ABC transporter substrate-binding protein [Baekduia sp.]
MSTPNIRRIRPLTVARTFAALTAVLATAVVASGCGSEDSASGASGGQTIRYQSSAGGVSPIELADHLGYLKPLKIKSVGVTISGPQDIQSAATNQTDIGGAFNGAVIKLIQAGAPIKSVISYYGSDAKTFQGFYVKDGSPIRTARDLIGKKVGMNTLGAHAEAILQTWLRKNGLSDSEVKQVQEVVIPPVNTEQALRAGQIDVGVLGGVLQDKAVARGGLRRLFSDYDLFGAFDAGTYVLRKQFIEQNPETAKTLVSGIAKAIVWLQTHPRDEVVRTVTEVAKAHGRPEDAAVLKYWKSPGIAAKGGVVQPGEIQRWITWLEASSQIPKGSVKAADAYTNEFNSLAPAASR